MTGKPRLKTSPPFALKASTPRKGRRPDVAIGERAHTGGTKAIMAATAARPPANQRTGAAPPAWLRAPPIAGPAAWPMLSIVRNQPSSVAVSAPFERSIARALVDGSANANPVAVTIAKRTTAPLEVVADSPPPPILTGKT